MVLYRRYFLTEFFLFTFVVEKNNYFIQFYIETSIRYGKQNGNTRTADPLEIQN